MKFVYKHIEVTQEAEIMPGIPAKHPVHKIYSTGGKKHWGTIVYDDTVSSFVFLPTEPFFFYPQHLEEILEYMKELKFEKELLTKKCFYCAKHEGENEDMKLFEVESLPGIYVHYNMKVGHGCAANKKNTNPYETVIPKPENDAKEV